MEASPRDQNHVPALILESSTTPGVVLSAKGSESTGRLLTTSAGGSGTVSSVSVVTANGFAGTVATATTTPAITLTTTITGILQGNGTAISAATTTGSGAVVLATTPTLVTPILGTPTSGTLTNCTGYQGSNLTGTVAAANGGTGQSTYAKGDMLASPGSNTLNKLAVGSDGQMLVADSASTNGVKWTTPATANTITVGTTAVGSGTTTRVLFDNAGVLGEYVISGTGSVAMTTSPSFTTPALGTPSAGVLSSCTGYAMSSLTGLGTGVATALAINVGSAGAVVVLNGALGTPSSGTVTNLTGTASININGTVGATTPGTGAFTTVSASSTITASTTIELGNATDTTLSRSAAGVLAVEGVVIPSISSTNTLTNKRITRRLVTVNAPGATPTTNTDNTDIANFTGLAAAITSMSSSLSGTPTDGDLIEFRFTDNATARAITWGASFGSTTVTLPTTTVISTMLRVLCEWNGSVWQCIATA